MGVFYTCVRKRVVNDVTDDIFRSGVPHAVETNLATRNAVNPRHAFLDVDPAVERAALDLQAASEPTPKPEETPPPSPLVVKEEPVHVSPTQQSDVLNTRDTLSATKEHIRDNIQALEKLAHSDNWQSVGKEAYRDNRQRLGKEHYLDNDQSLGATQSIHDSKFYLEKKSIRDNRQKISESATQRAAPQFPVPAKTTSVHTAHPVSENKAQVKPSISARVTQDDDEFRARMKKLKATVRDVNDSLSDLDPKL